MDSRAERFLAGDADNRRSKRRGFRAPIGGSPCPANDVTGRRRRREHGPRARHVAIALA